MMETAKDVFSLIMGTLLSLRQTIVIWDIVDILIIAYLIYKILSFMQKTSASSVIKGIVLLLVVAWLANALKLNVMKYILDQTLRMGIIVLIVLFQPELRKLFEKVGSSSISNIFRKRGGLEDVEASITSIADASAAMAKSKTGAIIVFERKIGLNDYAVTGTALDALITAELVQNIFFHNSPLHDGAMLVREGRLLAAGCMLPLSNNINLSRSLGMRHRAGVGISERSDAVVIIISEQSGAISVAVDGMLKRHLDKDTLEKLLRKELLLADDKRAAKKLKASG